MTDLPEERHWDLGAVERISTVEQVARALRDAIVDGRTPAGARLREVQLARLFGTGRGTVREAIRHLVQEGLVEYEVHRGAFVRVLTPEEGPDVYLAREVVEVGAVKKVLEADANSVDALVASSEALTNLQEFDKALKQLDKVIELNPRVHVVYVLRARVRAEIPLCRNRSGHSASRPT